jgi:arylsulfatase A-like enzyme
VDLVSQEIRAYLAGWLARGTARKPAFVYVHTIDPHGPYTPRGIYAKFARATPGKFPPESYDSVASAEKGPPKDPVELTHLRALYDGEVLYADRQFGRFLAMLKWLDRYDSSAIVLVSDHGEEFGEHGGVDHGRTVYEELLRVPLIIKFPNSLFAGTRVNRRVSTVDIFPTFLGLARLPRPPSGIDGESLSTPAALDRLAGVRPIYSEVSPVAEASSAEVNYRAISVGRLKGIESLTGIDQFCQPTPLWRVFDLESDPGERSPLDPADPRVNECWKALSGYLDGEQRKARYRESNRSEVDDEYIHKLRALGYLN